MLSWIAPLGDQRPQLDRLCRTVGPAVVQSEPTRMTELDLDAAPLAVVSWNTHVDGGEVVQFVRDLRAGRFSDGHPATHFVLLIQETFRHAADVPGVVEAGLRAPGRIAAVRRGDREPDIVDLARTLGLAFCYVPSMRNGPPLVGVPGEDRGNAILSTLPLTSLHALELPFERQRRVAIAGSVMLRWRRSALALELTSAHLDSMGSWRHGWVFARSLRVRQARALIAAASRGRAGVLGADLNAWSGTDEPAYRELQRAYAQTPSADRRPTFAHAGLRVDYLFFRLPDGLSAEYRRLDDRYGSDHYPLLGWIRAVP